MQHQINTKIKTDNIMKMLFSMHCQDFYHITKKHAQQLINVWVNFCLSHFLCF